jgi:hypothetical protein
MKKFIIIACASIFTMGCNNAPAPKETVTEAAPAAVAEKIDYAYLPEGHPPDYWDRGDQKNVALVLKSLKAFETGNIEEALVPFADSIQWTADGYNAKLSKDSLRSVLKAGWNQMSSMKVKMNDYEAVISKDKKEEFVTLWYKQIITDKKGKTDSMAYVDDLKIENGKIVSLDEKQRKFPAKK